MNLKFVNLVAVQFGMFLGIISWLAYSQLPFGEPRPVAKAPEPMTKPVATFAAADPGDQRSQTVDYGADQTPTQPTAEQPAVPVVQYEYSAEAVQRYAALAAQQYYQQIAPRRYASASVESNSTAAVAPTYAVVAPPPAAVETYDPEPEPVAYVQPTEVIVYQQPQFVAFSNSSRFANRCRPTFHHRDAKPGFARQWPNNGRLHGRGPRDCRPAKSIGVVQRRNDNAPSCRPSQGFAARGRR